MVVAANNLRLNLKRLTKDRQKISNPGTKLAPSRALRNCPVGNFSEGVRLPRGKK